MAKKSWAELTRQQKWRLGVLGVAQLALQFVVLRDIAERPAEEVNGPKAGWIAASFLNFGGPLAYLAFGRRN
ncbi:PLDc N-terminal domain-containing protein [Zhihengliuella sp.]|uniref:PLDc N-terminal domain-containing protein n=1 Tax=Zhihengliuella sp. TaxID=1954483 RepID=UPI0028124700|nr:PLDc N-terminal domain-containing protein [Zhihengliuella sp.]